jgi:hypothetical protein
MKNRRIAILILFLAMVMAVSGCIKKDTPKAVVNNNTQPVNVNENQDAGVVEEENKTSIIYAYRHFKDGKTKIFKSDINGNNKVELDINYGDGVNFTQSKDGKYIIRWDKDKIEVAFVKNLFFKKIFNVSNNDEMLSSVLISNNNKKIVFFVHKFLKPDEPFSPTEQYIYMMNTDGSEKTLVKQFIEPSVGDLLGVNLEKREFYWFEGGGGGGEFYNFTTLNLQDGSVKEIKKDINLFGNSLIFSSNFSKAYFIEGNKIFEYSFSDNNKKMLYELSNIGQDEYGNGSFIDRLRISPNEDMLVFVRVTEPDNKEITFSIDLKSWQVNTLLDDSRYYNIAPAHWSPDGNYLWFETFCHGCGDTSGYDNGGEYYLMDISTKELKLFFKSSRTEAGVRFDEHLNFIGWVVE